MKINPPMEAVRFMNRVEERRDHSSDGRQHSKHQKPGQEEDSPEVEQVDDEKVGAAIDAFQHDAQARAAGLNAAAIGSGPGLKVVLKDGSGAVIRQFTGEEFLKLREAVTQGGRGKILDQKL